jgi:para-nitrobenzyl esterase
VLLFVLAASCAWSAAGEVSTTEGRWSGIASPVDGAVTVYRGIPYAKPPLGALRWAAPVRPGAWQGVRKADEFGQPCWQRLVPETSIYSRGSMQVSEDCLTLNLWTRPAAELRPVMVWFHGGANTSGHGNSLIFDGTRLAQKGVVVVNVNYRLGPMGFFAHPALTAESQSASSGNYGLLDQTAALEWVQRNVAAFGGDPNRVTIFGQSAGAFDVCLLMASPLAKGLMHRVIAHSGTCLNVNTTLEVAEREGQSVAAHLATQTSAQVSPVPQRELEQLRANTPEEIMAAVDAVGAAPGTPIVDGWVVPQAPVAAFGAGRYNRIPLITGIVSDEFRGLGEAMSEMTREQYEAEVRERFGERADDVLATYESIADVSPREALRKISTHSFFGAPTRLLARLLTQGQTPAYVYHFSHPTAVFSLYIPERPEHEVPGGPRALGAYHSGDLAYHFNNVGVVGLHWQPWDRRLADMISDYWVNFARNGDPNGEGLPRWPRYTSKDLVQEFGATVTPVLNPPHREYDVFEAILAGEME